VLKEVLLTFKSLNFQNTHNSGCNVKAAFFSTKATGHKRLNVAEPSSPIACETAASVGLFLREGTGYPKLPVLSDNPLSYYAYLLWLYGADVCLIAIEWNIPSITK
jgi:hypothetical protein